MATPAAIGTRAIDSPNSRSRATPSGRTVMVASWTSSISAAAEVNHLSCWRSTPSDRRKRSTTETTEAAIQAARTPRSPAPRRVTAAMARPPVTATGRQRGDGSRAVGNSSGVNTKIRPRIGSHHPKNQAAAAATGSDPGAVRYVYSAPVGGDHRPDDHEGREGQHQGQVEARLLLDVAVGVRQRDGQVPGGEHRQQAPGDPGRARTHGRTLAADRPGIVTAGRPTRRPRG